MNADHAAMRIDTDGEDVLFRAQGQAWTLPWREALRVSLYLQGFAQKAAEAEARRTGIPIDVRAELAEQRNVLLRAALDASAMRHPALRPDMFKDGDA